MNEYTLYKHANKPIIKYITIQICLKHKRVLVSQLAVSSLPAVILLRGFVLMSDIHLHHTFECAASEQRHILYQATALSSGL